MNFFEHQDRARKQTRWLVLAFALAVGAIVVAIDLILLVVLGVTGSEPGQAPISLKETVTSNLDLLAGGAVACLLVIGLASLFKTASLRSGGGQVARQLGGTLVESDTRDLSRRRLRNVVEEIALASGVPVPDIYVLEQESGINAFAAGFTPADAAVAVTRGALEKLDRNELQGVIAHEFSHILNGDMRINIRLMGALFGILLLALIGRRVLIHSHFAGRSRDRNGAVVLLIAFGLVFELPIVIFFLARMGVVDYKWLAKNRKFALLAGFIIGAVLTPPDVFSQTALALPFVVLYEVGIWVARFFGKKKEVEEVDEDEEKTE